MEEYIDYDLGIPHNLVCKVQVFMCIFGVRNKHNLVC